MSRRRSSRRAAEGIQAQEEKPWIAIGDRWDRDDRDDSDSSCETVRRSSSFMFTFITRVRRRHGVGRKMMGGR